jgi:hypothetical protein
MRAHLATCSPLRSSAYRKYASSLRGCARVDLHPPPAITPAPHQKFGRRLASLAAGGFLTPPLLPQRLRTSDLPRVAALEAKCTSEAMCRRHRASGQWGGAKNPLRDAAHRFPGGEGANRGRRVRPDTRAAAQGGGVLVRRTTGAASTWRDGPSSRDSRTGRGHCGRGRADWPGVLRT